MESYFKSDYPSSGLACKGEIPYSPFNYFINLCFDIKGVVLVVFLFVLFFFLEQVRALLSTFYHPVFFSTLCVYAWPERERETAWDKAKHRLFFLESIVWSIWLSATVFGSGYLEDSGIQIPFSLAPPYP